MSFIFFQVKKIFKLGKLGLGSILTFSLFMLLFHASLCNFRRSSHFYSCKFTTEAKKSLSDQELRRYEELYHQLKAKYQELKSENFKSELEDQFWIRGDCFYWSQFFEKVFKESNYVDGELHGELDPRISFIKTKAEEWKKLHKDAEDLEPKIVWDDEIYKLAKLSGDFGSMFRAITSLWNFYQKTNQLIKEVGIWFTYEYKRDLKGSKELKEYSNIKFRDKEFLEKISVYEAQKKLEGFSNFMEKTFQDVEKINYPTFDYWSNVFYGLKQRIKEEVNRLRICIQEGKYSKNIYDFYKLD